jgi:hypothetical protein
MTAIFLGVIQLKTSYKDISGLITLYRTGAFFRTCFFICSIRILTTVLNSVFTRADFYPDIKNPLSFTKSRTSLRNTGSRPYVIIVVDYDYEPDLFIILPFGLDLPSGGKASFGRGSGSCQGRRNRRKIPCVKTR